MFPDPSVKWRAYPSIMDGIKAPPFVLDRGMWRGRLNLIVLEPAAFGTRAYGAQIACQIYGAFEEMIYSIANYGVGDRGSAYRGDVYLKEAEHSNLLKAYRNADPMKRTPRHFLFVGSDFCYETVGFEEPVVCTFASREDAYAWLPGGDA